MEMFAAEKCDRMFFDRLKPRRGSCLSTLCGNRAKTRLIESAIATAG